MYLKMLRSVRKQWLCNRFIAFMVFSCMFSFYIVAYGNNKDEGEVLGNVYFSAPWGRAINQSMAEQGEYPNRRKITPTTLRLTIERYYLPQVSDLLSKGVDYIEWLDEVDNQYLKQYKLDMKVDTTDGLLKLFWKESF